MNKNLKLFLLFSTVSILVGCANLKNMPLQEIKDESLDLSKQSILVGRLTIKNQNAKNWQPNLIAIFTKQDGKTFSYVKPTLVSETPKVGKDYLFSMSSQSGTAELKQVRFLSRALLVNGIAEIQFKQNIEFPESGIFYIGNIDARVVPKKEGDPLAGPVVPLIDQSVTGYSSGTFIVDINDNYDEDVKLLFEKYPYLEGQEIKKMILPKWVHPSKREKK